MTTTTRRRRTKLKNTVRGRLKALAAGIGGYVAIGIAYVLLDPDSRATLTTFVPEWARSMVLVLMPIGLAWAVERTRNRGPDAPTAD